MQFTFDDLVAVMAKLRAADGCPWDREQTHASLAPYLLEESHEVLDAISGGDAAALRVELGDVLLQVVFHAQMAHEVGSFDADAVVDGLTRKLLHRHPHVFGDLRLGTAREVKAHWQEIKRQEDPGRALFEGVPASLPALARAQKVLGRVAEDRAAGAKPIDAAVAAVETGLRRAEAALGSTRGAGVVERVLGELLLSVVALAAAAGIDAENALRDACERVVVEAETQST